ncbi:hypothetical protein B7494_g4929 [Chlorociboria aeruginascens]|nr:hypothetical protein B7494_g4929 [Chlorociboria aeruginascens]
MAMLLEGTSILVTGGVGQVGIAVIQHIQTEHPTVQISVLDLTKPEAKDPAFISRVDYHVGSITDRVIVKELFLKVQPQVVFHTAGLIPSIAKKRGMNTEDDFMKVNVEGTRILIEEARMTASVKAFVYTSSSDVLRDRASRNLINVDESTPIPESFDTPYPKSKALAESLVLSSSTPAFPTTALRPHAVFSAHDNNLLPLVILTRRNIYLGPGKNIYDFTYAPDLALAHLLAAKNLLTVSPAEKSNPASAAGKAFFITNSEPVPLQAFIKWIWEAYDGKQLPKGTKVPVKLATAIIGLLEIFSGLVGKKAEVTVDNLRESLADRWFNNTRAKEILGYVPSIGLEEAVKVAVEGYKELRKS